MDNLKTIANGLAAAYLLLIATTPFWAIGAIVINGIIKG